MSEEEYSNGKSFTEFETLDTDQKLNYVYMELVAQRNRHSNLKKELKIWVAVFTAIITAAWQIAVGLFKKNMGIPGG